MNLSITSVSVCVYYTEREFYSRFQFCLAKLVHWLVNGRVSVCVYYTVQKFCSRFQFYRVKLVRWLVSERVSNCVYCTACECFFCGKPRGFYLNFEKFCIFFAKFGPKKSFLEILILGINQDVISS